MKSSSIIFEKILGENPYNLLPISEKKNLLDKFELVDFIDGEKVNGEADELSQHVYLIISGPTECLGSLHENNELITIDKVGKGSTFGWVGVLRGEPCETINASRSLMTVRIKIQDFVELIEKYEEFRENFENNYNKQEAWHVMTTYCRKNAFRPDNLNPINKRGIRTR